MSTNDTAPVPFKGTAGAGGQVSHTGVTLTMTQVMALVIEAGGKGRRTGAATAAAVAFAESGGNTTARCYNYRDPVRGNICSSTPRADATSVDRGLWQINSRWHPEVSDQMADHPEQAAAAMFRISGGLTSFGAWATYNSGSYRRFMPAALGAYDDLTAKGPGAVTAALSSIGQVLYDAGNGAVSAVQATMSVGEFLGKLGSAGTWVRVVQVVGGLGCLVMGALLLRADLIPGIGASKASPAKTLGDTAKGSALGAGASKAAGAALGTASNPLHVAAAAV